MPDISREVLIKASRGDIESFELIYSVTSGFVYNVAYRILHNTHDAEEVAQEVFLNVYHKLKIFRLESSFRTWIYRITVNCSINHLKKIKRTRERDGKQEISECAAPRHDNETVNILLKVLSPDQKTCVVLRNIEGLSYRQIADTLKINVNTVRSRLKRVREKMIEARKGVMKDEL